MARGPMSEEARERIAAGRRAQIARDREAPIVEPLAIVEDRTPEQLESDGDSRPVTEDLPLCDHPSSMRWTDEITLRGGCRRCADSWDLAGPVPDPEPHTDANDVDFGEGAPNDAADRAEFERELDGNETDDETLDDFPQRFPYGADINVEPVTAAEASVASGFAVALRPEADALVLGYRHVREASLLLRGIGDGRLARVCEDVRRELATAIADRAADAA